MAEKAIRILFHEYYHDSTVKIRISVWQLPKKDWNRYPIKFKYSLICINSKNGKKVLMDNHHPKGPHVHLDEKEINYQFKSVSELLNDFREFCRKHMEIGL